MPSGPERHRLDLGRAGQRGEHHVALPRHLGRRIGPDGAVLDVAVGRGASRVVNDDLVLGLLQVGGEARAHDAEPDESDFHLMLPL